MASIIYSTPIVINTSSTATYYSYPHKPVNRFYSLRFNSKSDIKCATFRSAIRQALNYLNEPSTGLRNATIVRSWDNYQTCIAYRYPGKPINWRWWSDKKDCWRQHKYTANKLKQFNHST